MRLHEHSSGTCKSESFSTSTWGRTKVGFSGFPQQMIFGQTQGRLPSEEVYETLEQVPGNIMEEPIWRE